MAIFENVAVGLSLSESDRQLIEYAALLAKFEIVKKFQFVHVITSVTEDQSPDQILKQIQADVLKQFVGLSVQPAVEFHVRKGVRVDELLAYVQEYRCDLFLLGHRKNRSGKRSLAKRMAMISPASVWMVPEDAPRKIFRVLAPIDFSTHSADSLTIAARIALNAGLKECHALHVFFDSSTVRYDEHLDEVRGNEERTFAKFVSPLDLAGIEVKPRFEEASNVTNAIMHVTKQEQCDLIVMSTRGRSAATSILLGSETLQTFSDSHVPVLAVKHQGAFLNLFQLIKSPEMWSNESLKTN